MTCVPVSLANLQEATNGAAMGEEVARHQPPLRWSRPCRTPTPQPETRARACPRTAHPLAGAEPGPPILVSEGGQRGLSRQSGFFPVK